MSNNNFVRVDPDWFKYQSSLQVLDLSLNGYLSDIENGTFAALGSLQYLFAVWICFCGAKLVQ